MRSIHSIHRCGWLVTVAVIGCLAGVMPSGCDNGTDSGPSNPNGAMEQQTHGLINGHRASKSLAALVFDEAIAAIAREHSQNMANGTVAFGHDGFDERVARVQAIMAISRAGENVAYNSGYSDPAATAVAGWLKSPGHLANIEGDYNRTGIGIVKDADNRTYFTQIFVKTR